MLQSKHCMGLNWMAKKSKWNKHVHEKKVVAVDVVEAVIGHTGLEALDEEVDLEVAVEVAEEMTVEVEEVETAITAISQGIWHEIAEKNVKKEVVAEVDLEVVEEEEAEATERATIAIKKDTWQENAQKETAEIVRNSEETSFCTTCQY